MSDPHHELESIPAAAPGMTPRHTHCANCGAPLHGPFCHQCGQSIKNMLRHLPALTADAAESLFGLDGRLMHTLPALYFKPGFLAREYFAGRRMRYIPPFRLMFFMSVLAFLLIQLALNLDRSLLQSEPTINTATTSAAVRAAMQNDLANIDKARSYPKLPDIGQLALNLASHTIPIRANHRLHQLGATPLPASSVPAAPSTVALARQLDAIAHAPTKSAVNVQADKLSLAVVKSENLLRDNDSSMLPQAWLAKLNDSIKVARQRGLKRVHAMPAASSSALSVPDINAIKINNNHHVNIFLDEQQLHSALLPTFVKERLRAGIARAKANIKAINSGSSASRTQSMRRVAGDIISVTPQTLFVLIPLLALLLKLMYVFKSRLYIEHLIVALYSHAFIFQTLLLSVLLGLITWWLPPWADTPASWLQAALWIWLPVYLLLMQKRVYAQCWFLTVMKYGCVGLCYGILLTFAVVTATLIGVAS